MKKYIAVLLSFLFCFIGSNSLKAQNYLYQTGNPQFSTQIPIENGFINVNNGDIHIEIPLATHSQRGSLQLNERLVYDSRIWKIVQNNGYSWQPTNVPNSMGGWTFFSGGEAGSGVSYNTLSGSQTCGGNEGMQPYSIYWGFAWTDPQGTSHTFPQANTTRYTQSPAANCTEPTGFPNSSSYASDGSGYYIKVTNYTQATIYDKQGNMGTQDRNGNYWSNDANGNLVDTVGRTPVKVTNSGNLIYYDVLGEGGANERYTVTTETINFHTNFGQTGVSPEASGSFTAIQSIALPDGSSYSFTYDSGTAPGNYGELTGVTLPTGGTIQYGYTDFLDSFQNENRWVNTRLKDGGTTTFTPATISNCSSNAGCQEKVTVTSPGPSSNDTVYTFNLDSGAYANAGSWNAGIDVYQGSSGGTKLQSSTTTYTYQTSYAQAGAAIEGTYLSPIGLTATTTLPAVGLSSQTSTALDVVGNPTSVKQWDYYSGSAPASPTIETDYTYGYVANFAEFPTQVIGKDASGNQVAKTTYGYDETTGSGHFPLVTVSNLPQQPVTVTGNRGNLTTVSQWVNTNGSTVSTTAAYDSAGSLVSSTTANGTTSYGHDSTDTFVTQVTRPVTNGVQHISTSAFDPSTGLIIRSDDENSHALGSIHPTLYTYESTLSRIQSVTYPDGGRTTYTYPSNREIDSTTLATPDPSISSQAIADVYGRKYQTIQAGVSSETTYDTNGRISCVTNPHSGASSPTDGTTCVSQYDGLGRPLVQTEPGGNTLTWSYTGNTVYSNDEAGHQWQRSYDAFGRLSKVTEPSGASTTYVYDALNNLRTVSQNGVTGDTARVRTFNYDSLSRLITASSPETGTICYGTWSGSSCINGYDGNGNLIAKTDARNITVTYGYDALNRMTTKVASDGSFTYQYMYDLSSQTNSIGRLSYESNDVNAAGAFNYDAMGRVTSRSYCVPSNCSLTIQAQATYDLAGNMTSQTYPDGRKISQGFDGAGRISSVSYTGWGGNGHSTPYLTTASSGAYDPAGHLINATMGNGLGIAAAYDSRERVNSLLYGTSTNLLWGKYYQWTPNSSVSAIDDAVANVQRHFSYDSLNRLTAAQDVSASGSTVPPPGDGSSSSGEENTSNILPSAQTFNSWTPNDVTVSVNAAVAPDGSKTAALVTGITDPNGHSPDGFIVDYVSAATLYDGQQMNASVWLRSQSGTQVVDLYIAGSSASGTPIVINWKPVTLTTSWQQFQVVGTNPSEISGLSFQIGGGASIQPGNSFYVWGAELQPASGVGSSVTNFLPYSQRTTASSWAIAGSSTTVDNTATAPDGTNTAATVTATSGSTDTYVIDYAPNPSSFDGAAVVASVYLRATSGTQNITLYLAQISSSGNTPIAHKTVTLTTVWQRVQFTGTAPNGLSQLYLQIGGGGTIIAGDSFNVWGAQMELGTTAGSYVQTASVPVTQGANFTNILPFSQQPNGSSWEAPGSGSVALYTVSAPDGTNTGATVTAASGSTDTTIIDRVPDPSLYDGAKLTASVYLRAAVPQNINLYLWDISAAGFSPGNGVSAAVTTSWQRFEVTRTVDNGLTQLGLQIGGSDSVQSGQSFNLWGAQMEVAPSMGPYVATSATPVTTGSEYSNILPFSEQLNGANWGIAAGTVASNSVLAPDGTNTGATLTANANATDSYAIDNTSNPFQFDGTTVTGSVYLRANTSQNVNLYLVNNGAIVGQQPTYAAVTTVWQRFQITGTVQNGLSQLALQIGGADSLSSGQSINVWGAQMVEGTSPEPYTSTSDGTTNVVSGQAGTLVPNGLNEIYSYDSFGNLQQNGGFNDSFTAKNQMLGYAYDAAGNLLSNYLTTMTWDAESKLTSAGGATYIYNPEGDRVEKQGVGVEDTIFFGGRPIARYSGGSWTDLIYGPNGMFAEVAGTEAALPNYRLLDHLGNQVGTVGSTILLTNPMDYTPFGQVWDGSTNDPYMFTGLERDPESNLDHTQFRQYSSTNGRWMSPDPYNGSMDLGNPQSLNRYSYVLNRPLNLIDPSGLQGVDPCPSDNCGSGGDGCGAICVGVTLGIGALVGEIASLFDHPAFHGSLQPRPNANGMTTANGTYSTITTDANGVGFMQATYTTASNSAYSLSWSQPLFTIVVPVGEIPIPIASLTFSPTFTYIPKMRTACLGGALGLASGTGKGLTFAAYPSTDASFSEDVVSSFGWNFQAQTTPYTGFNVLTNSSGTLSGLSVSSTTGAAASYGWTSCRHF